MSNLIICADDFGLSKNINKSILELAQNKKIQATSIMFNKECRSQIIELSKIPSLEMGLHFYMTGLPIGDITLTQPISLYNHTSKIANQFYYQIASLEDLLGKKVDYIDSHQYILSFPFVMRKVVEKYNSLLDERLIKLGTSPILINNKIRGLSYLSEHVKKKYKSFRYIDGILGISNFNKSINEIRDNFFYEKEQIKKISGKYHYSTHPCENPIDIPNSDKLTIFRKLDYFFLKDFK